MILKLKARETLEYRTPKGKISTIFMNTKADRDEVGIENKKSANIISQYFPVEINKKMIGDIKISISNVEI